MSTVYVGLWSLLPEDWEGINGLYEKSEKEIREEVKRQGEILVKKHYDGGEYVGIYESFPFEETFNGDDEGDFNGTTYWIKIF